MSKRNSMCVYLQTKFYDYVLTPMRHGASPKPITISYPYEVYPYTSYLGDPLPQSSRHIFSKCVKIIMVAGVYNKYIITLNLFYASIGYNQNPYHKKLLGE